MQINLMALTASVFFPIEVSGWCSQPLDPACMAPVNAGIYMCQKVNWEGECYHYLIDRDEDGAQYLPYEWSDGTTRVGSWGPDKGINTTLFDTNGGSGNSLTISYPGLADMGTYWNTPNNYFVVTWPLPGN